MRPLLKVDLLLLSWWCVYRYMYLERVYIDYACYTIYLNFNKKHVSVWKYMYVHVKIVWFHYDVFHFVSNEICKFLAICMLLYMAEAWNGPRVRHMFIYEWNFRIDCFLIYVNVHHDFIYMWHCLLSVDHQIWFYLAIYEWLIRLQWLIFAINFFFTIKQRAKNIKDLVCNEKYSE